MDRGKNQTGEANTRNEIKNEKLVIQHEQTKGEFDAKLLSTEAILFKERKYYDSVKKEYDISVKNYDRLTEELESLKYQLNLSKTLCNKLTMNLDRLSLKKSKIEDNFSQLQKEMVLKVVQHDSDKKDLQYKVDKALKDNEQLQLDFVAAQNEIESTMKEETEKYSSEIAKLSRELKFKDQTLASYEQELQNMKDHLQKVRSIY